MLIVTRRVNETITIDAAEGLDRSMPISEAFRDGAIEIKLLHIAGQRVRVAVEAPRQLRIWRGSYDSLLEQLRKNSATGLEKVEANSASRR